jgi:hypothetical protein
LFSQITPPPQKKELLGKNKSEQADEMATWNEQYPSAVITLCELFNVQKRIVIQNAVIRQSKSTA